MRSSILISLFAISLAALAPTASADLNTNASMEKHRRLFPKSGNAPDEYDVKITNVSKREKRQRGLQEMSVRVWVGVGSASSWSI